MARSDVRLWAIVFAAIPILAIVLGAMAETFF